MRNIKLNGDSVAWQHEKTSKSLFEITINLTAGIQQRIPFSTHKHVLDIAQDM